MVPGKTGLPFVRLKQHCFKGEKIIEIYNEMGVGTDGVNAHCFFLRH